MQLARGRMWLIAGLVAAYAAFLAWYHAPYAGGSDSSGYVNSARLPPEGRAIPPDTHLRPGPSRNTPNLHDE